MRTVSRSVTFRPIWLRTPTTQRLSVVPASIDAAVADQAVLQAGRVDARGGQDSACGCRSRLRELWKSKGGIGAGQGQVGFVIGLDRAEVFPVAVEQMGLHAMRWQCCAGRCPCRSRWPAAGALSRSNQRLAVEQR